jgi:hypothetical protein
MRSLWVGEVARGSIAICRSLETGREVAAEMPAVRQGTRRRRLWRVVQYAGVLERKEVD